MKSESRLNKSCGALCILSALAISSLTPAMAQPGTSASGAATTSGVITGSATAASTTKAADRTLSKAVRAAMQKERGLDTTGVAIRAHEGEVTLKGSMPNADQIATAQRIAQSVPGVVSVTNKLVVAPHGGLGR
ncbi:BON domain-containing protein [Paraburkholderia sp. J63]|uniref:BON domain-containing protein n=1 Tax=Paraburkholderia sp. J63 TaxID=2805434 RepID=UPI002ABD6928|nr:BON domain-containing protein [Paraburkholderia sp. J63]